MSYKKSKETRRTILEATRRVLDEIGYAALRVDAIARQAGVAKGSLYYYFESTDAIVAELLCTQLFVTLKQAAETAQRPDLALQSLLMQLFSVTNEATPWRAWFEGEIPPKIHQDIDSYRRERVLPMLLQLVEEGVRQGLFQIQQPDILTRILYLGFDSYLHIYGAHLANEKEYSRFIESAEVILSALLQPKRPLKLNNNLLKEEND